MVGLPAAGADRSLCRATCHPLNSQEQVVVGGYPQTGAARLTKDDRVSNAPSDIIDAEPIARRSRGRAVTRWVLAAAVLGVVVAAQFGFVESFTFYVPTRNAIAVPLHVRQLKFAAADGVKLDAWFIPARDWKPGDAARPAVLFCHGNGGQLAYHMQFCEFLAAAGVHVMIFDYRGYGESDQARRVRGSLMLDARAALATLRAEPGVDATRLGLYGMSLGGVFATALAAENPNVKALCTLSTFSSWRGVASDHVPLIAPILIPGGLDPVESVTRLGRRPYLLIHGTADAVISVRHAYLLRDAAEKVGARVDFRIASGGDHAMVLFDFPEMERAVAEFFVRELDAR